MRARAALAFFMGCMLLGSGLSAAEEQGGASSKEASLWDTLRLRGRGIFRYEMRAREKFDGWSDELELNRARFDVRFRPIDELRLMLELELTSGVKLKDAYVRYDLHRLAKIKVGHFKKPFSALRMKSRWDLLIPRRGLVDGHVIGGSAFGGFGGRDAGAVISGSLGKGKRVKLRYELGVFDGWRLNDDFFRDPDDPEDENASHRDYVGRLRLSLFKLLDLGVSYSHKVARIALAPGIEMNRTFNAVSADLAFNVAGLGLELEGTWASNPNAAAGHHMLGGHGIVSFSLRIDDFWALTPALMIEALDADDEVDGKTALRLAGAINLDVGAYTRIVLAAEGGFGEMVWIEPEYASWDQANNSVSAPRKVDTRVMLQLQVRL